MLVEVSAQALYDGDVAASAACVRVAPQGRREAQQVASSTEYMGAPDLSLAMASASKGISTRIASPPRGL